MSDPFDREGVRWWLAEGTTRAEAEPRIGAALAALADGAENLKRGRRKALYRLDLAGGGSADSLLKVNHYPKGRRRASKARRELRAAEAVAARGIATPVPLAAGERREGGRIVACYLLVAILPGVTDLREHLKAGAGTPADRRRLAAGFGRFARALHDAGIDQDDFQPNNFLVRAAPGREPELWMIDFERTRIARRVSRARRCRALAKLERETSGTPATLRLRFLRGYASPDAAPAAQARAWWAQIRADAPRLARRDATRLRRNATRPGRRFERVHPGGAVGLAAPGVALGALERALAGSAATRGDVVAIGGEDLFAVTLAGLGVGAARTALARALVLAARGLSPPPLAVLCGKDRNVLVLSRAPRSLRASEVRDNPSVSAARRVLERRLAGYGRLLRAPDPGEVALVPTGGNGVRATLLGIEAFAPRSLPRMEAFVPRSLLR